MSVSVTPAGSEVLGPEGKGLPTGRLSRIVRMLDFLVCRKHLCIAFELLSQAPGTFLNMSRACSCPDGCPRGPRALLVTCPYKV